MKHITEKMPIKASKYDKVPENYTDTIYICPMHPEVRDIEKSDCRYVVCFCNLKMR